MTGDHYFSQEPSATGRSRIVEYQVNGRPYRLDSAGGVFSADRLDPGTAVLLRKAPLPDSRTQGPLLDLGCGYGPIAVVLATEAPLATVYAVDVNRRALDLVRRNADGSGAAERIVTSAPDDVPDGLRFAQIWSNPPIRVGKAELHDLLDRWLPRLTDDGVGWLVIAKHLGGDTVQRWLVEERGWRVERHASQKGYRVLRVTRS